MIGRSKYGAKKCIVDGIKFDSKEEAKHYTFLKAMEAQGQITNLELQPEFWLVPSFKLDGKTIRGMKYFADFRFKNISGETIVQDVKGFKTETYKIKLKMFQFTYCIRNEFKFFEIMKAGQTDGLY
jgi:hypothetical protein